MDSYTKLAISFENKKANAACIQRNCYLAGKPFMKEAHILVFWFQRKVP